MIYLHNTYLVFFYFGFSFALCYASPYAPSTIGTTPGADDYAIFDYDSSGNRMSNERSNLAIEMGLLSKASVVTKGTQHENFKHGPLGKRYLSIRSDGSKTMYLSNGEFEYRINSEGASSVVYVRNGNYSPIAQVNLTTNSYTYNVQDLTGSTLRRVDDAGASVLALRYDPWGQQTTASGVGDTPFQRTFRGFTGHENIFPDTLINMNARLNDPDIAQFAGPDPILQNTGHIKFLNRYSYVHHNPLIQSDPTGLMPERLMPRRPRPFTEVDLKTTAQRIRIRAKVRELQGRKDRAATVFAIHEQQAFDQRRAIKALERTLSIRRDPDSIGEVRSALTESESALRSRYQKLPGAWFVTGDMRTLRETTSNKTSRRLLADTAVIEHIAPNPKKFSVEATVISSQDAADATTVISSQDAADVITMGLPSILDFRSPTTSSEQMPPSNRLRQFFRRKTIESRPVDFGSLDLEKLKQNPDDRLGWPL